jgi:hypothetical protein
VDCMHVELSVCHLRHKPSRVGEQASVMTAGCCPQGRRGWAALPNSDFWPTVGSLVRDGVAFSGARLRGRRYRPSPVTRQNLLPPAGKKPRSPKGSTGTERRKKEKRRKGGKQESTGGHSSSRGTSFADADKKDAGEVMQGVGGGGGTLTEQRDCAVHSSMQRVKVVAAST